MPSLKLITAELIDEFIFHISDADAIYLLISFVMTSGVRILAPHLRDAAARGTEIKLLAGDYLFVTQPEALTLLHDTHTVEETSSVYTTSVQPRPAQLEALQQLRTTKEEEYDKALVVMATGLGKTFLAAMFAKDYDRILFIAHREEILSQASRAFHSVLPEKTSGFLTGKQKDYGTEILLASVMTLGQKRHRTQFDRHHFDLIIVDEFHHAAAASYRAVMDWFQPKFLLGITATPDRVDHRDVYSLCDGNVAYRIDFLEAIDRQWLAPFHYIGVYDDTDYSLIRWLGTKYDEQELLAAQTRDSMANKRGIDPLRPLRSRRFFMGITWRNLFGGALTGMTTKRGDWWNTMKLKLRN